MFCGRLASLYYLWVCIQFYETDSSTMVKIKLVRYNIPDGKTMDGEPCNQRWGPCKPYFNICLDQPNGDAEFGRCYSTKWYSDQNVIAFGSLINGGVENPIKLSIPHWKGGIGIKVNVTNKGYSKGDEPIDKLFYTYNQTHLRSEKFSKWKGVSMKGNRRKAEKTILLLNIKAYCEQDWYGSDCSVKCAPTDGFICDKTGQLICISGSRCDIIPRTVKTSKVNINKNVPQPQNAEGMSAGSAVGITLGVVAIVIVIIVLVVLYIKTSRNTNKTLTEPDTEHSWALSRNFRLFIIRIIWGRPVNPDSNVLPIKDGDGIPALPAAEQRALLSTENTDSSSSVTETQTKNMY